MRAFIRRRAAVYGLDEAHTFQAQLVATEAVTNAMRHAGHSGGMERPIVVKCRPSGEGIAIEVRDRGRFRRRRRRGSDATSGRGLRLIERFSSQFELETSDEGTRLRMLVRAPA